MRGLNLEAEKPRAYQTVSTLHFILFRRQTITLLCHTVQSIATLNTSPVAAASLTECKINQIRATELKLETFLSKHRHLELMTL